MVFSIRLNFMTQTKKIHKLGPRVCNFYYKALIGKVYFLLYKNFLIKILNVLQDKPSPLINKNARLKYNYSKISTLCEILKNV